MKKLLLATMLVISGLGCSSAPKAAFQFGQTSRSPANAAMSVDGCYRFWGTQNNRFIFCFETKDFGTVAIYFQNTSQPQFVSCAVDGGAVLKTDKFVFNSGIVSVVMTDLKFQGNELVKGYGRHNMTDYWFERLPQQESAPLLSSGEAEACRNLEAGQGLFENPHGTPAYQEPRGFL